MELRIGELAAAETCGYRCGHHPHSFKTRKINDKRKLEILCVSKFQHPPQMAAEAPTEGLGAMRQLSRLPARTHQHTPTQSHMVVLKIFSDRLNYQATTTGSR